MAILNVPIQVRVDNEQNWDNSTLILKDGEPALCKKEDGTQELKFGDGQKTYKELSPFGGNQVEENSGDLLVTLTSIENNQASATYEQIKATINNKHLVAVIYEEEVYMLDKVQSNGTIEFRLDNSQGQKYLGISSSGVWYENSSSWQAVNISIDEVEGLEATNVQDALAELKEDGVQLNDNAVNTTEAWSSKKIVDTLCPAFTVEGNPVTCQPVEGYPLGVKVSFSPRQEGEGDPSPENVRPISGYDSLCVTRCGKNILPYPYNDTSKTVSGITFTTKSDGTVIVNGTATNMAIFILTNNLNFITKSTIFISGCPVGGSKSTYCIKNVQSGHADIGNGVPVIGEKINKLEIEIGPGTVCNNLVFTPMVCLTQNETYEPYQGDTYDIALPETVYGGTVDAVTGAGSEEWGFYQLTGTETTFVYDKYFYVNMNQSPGYALSLSDGVCSHYKYTTFGNEGFIGVPTTARQIVFTPGSMYTLDEKGVEQWKSYLAAQASAGTPVQVAYKLATPETFQATGNQALPAVAGLNTVYTDGDSLAVSGRSDPTAYIQQQISDAITAAVAITGGT